ncbi:hypothetical protein QP794_14785 [Paenibacillus sp. UMB7766-LJ446]|uniref:hypothetical protein n=1 Tax=Paenibacillus sp. UMB7766-LJ446 TaxID=3046313 RepID=UPI00254EF071|nr:hypothetical protein [Paenibacillus sp. UMB7766-LJ446]MDK8191353.1 hypothetical protein [Paenibacillus sp. UMB7766-LJ446]
MIFTKSTSRGKLCFRTECNTGNEYLESSKISNSHVTSEKMIPELLKAMCAVPGNTKIEVKINWSSKR